MFFTPDLLGRKHSLGKFYLMGNDWPLRKNELRALAAHLFEVIDLLLAPPVPWSLRSQGWLLSGIVKVYRFMAIHLGEDVLYLSRLLRRLQDEHTNARASYGGVLPVAFHKITRPLLPDEDASMCLPHELGGVGDLHLHSGDNATGLPPLEFNGSAFRQLLSEQIAGPAREDTHMLPVDDDAYGSDGGHVDEADEDDEDPVVGGSTINRMSVDAAEEFFLAGPPPALLGPGADEVSDDGGNLPDVTDAHQEVDSPQRPIVEQTHGDAVDGQDAPPPPSSMSMSVEPRVNGEHQHQEAPMSQGRRRSSRPLMQLDTRIQLPERQVRGYISGPLKSQRRDGDMPSQRKRQRRGADDPFMGLPRLHSIVYPPAAAALWSTLVRQAAAEKRATRQARQMTPRPSVELKGSSSAVEHERAAGDAIPTAASPAALQPEAETFREQTSADVASSGYELADPIEGRDSVPGEMRSQAEMVQMPESLARRRFSSLGSTMAVFDVSARGAEHRLTCEGRDVHDLQEVPLAAVGSLAGHGLGAVQYAADGHDEDDDAAAASGVASSHVDSGSERSFRAADGDEEIDAADLSGEPSGRRATLSACYTLRTVQLMDRLTKMLDRPGQVVDFEANVLQAESGRVPRAQRVYDLLVLASDCRVEVSQQQAFGTIEVRRGTAFELF